MTEKLTQRLVLVDQFKKAVVITVQTLLGHAMTRTCPCRGDPPCGWSRADMLLQKGKELCPEVFVAIEELETDKKGRNVIA